MSSIAFTCAAGACLVVETPGSGVSTGQSLRDVLHLTDTILHINNTAITTRPDLFSHIGFARECVALGLAEWKEKPAFKIPPSPKTKDSFSTFRSSSFFSS